MPIDAHEHQTTPGRYVVDYPIEAALDDGQMMLYYQPIVNVSNRQIVSHEALLRWEHPTDGLLTPDQFLPFAELHSSIENLNEWTATAACTQSRTWQDQGLPARVAINVSPSQIVADRFTEQIGAALVASGADPANITLEVTESALTADTDCVIAVMNTLQPIGITFALDDFCTGHSSLSQLARITFDCVKIDRTFIATLDHDHRAVSLLDGLVRLTKTIGLPTVAEGVETEKQLACTRDLGVDYAQGYLLGRPQPATQSAGAREQDECELTSDERLELAELRQAKRQLELENELLRRSAASFAKDLVDTSASDSGGPANSEL